MKQRSYSTRRTRERTGKRSGSFGMVLLTMTLLGGIAIDSTPLIAQDTNRTKRVANSDPWQTWPRWTPPTYLNQYDEEGNLALRARDMDLRHNGEVHLLLEGNDGDSTFVAYANNRPETRGGTGFSLPLVLRSSSGTREVVRPGDIAVSDGGDIAVAYTVERPTDTTSSHDGERYGSIYLMRFLPEIGWGKEEVVAEGSREITGAVEEVRSSSHPRIYYDRNNELHLTWFERITRWDTAEGGYLADERRIWYSHDTGARQEVVAGHGPEVIDEALADYPEPPVAVEARRTEHPHVVWPHRHNGEDYVGVGVRFESGWQTSKRQEQGSEPDMAIDPEAADEVAGVAADRSHIVYVRNDSVFYAQVVASEGIIATIDNTATPLPRSLVTRRVHAPKVAVAEDSDPVVLFNYGDDRIGMAVREGNDWIGRSDWSLQAPIAMPPWILDDQIGVSDVKISPATHAVHFVGRLYWPEGGFLPPDRLREGGFYARTGEFNLGDQDSLAQVRFGPDARANVATGNLDVILPLFSGSGGGLNTELSLRYNSLDNTPSIMSPGWKLNYEISLIDHRTSRDDVYDFVTLRLGDGREVIFSYRTRVGDDYGYYVALEDFGYYSRIERDRPTSGAWTMTTKHGDRYIFDNRGRLNRILTPTSDTLTIVWGPNPESDPDLLPSRQAPSLIVGIADALSPARPATSLRYDRENRLVEIVDPAGASFLLTYLPHGGDQLLRPDGYSLHQVRFPDPGEGNRPVWEFTRSTGSLLLGSIRDPLGLYSYGYYTDRRIAEVVEPEARSVVDEFNPDAGPVLTRATQRIEYIDPPLPFDRSFLGREPGEEVNVPRAVLTDGRGYETTFEYQYVRALVDRVAWPVIGLDPDPGVVQRRWAGYNPVNPAASMPTNRNLVMEINEVGAATGYAWHTEATPPYVKDNLRAVYRPAGSAPTDILNPGSFLMPEIHEWTDDGFNRLRSVTDARGNTTTREYDAAGSLIRVIYPDATLPDGSAQKAEEAFSRDAGGRVVAHTDREGNRTTREYVGRMRVPSEVRRPGTSGPDRYTYDMMGNLLSSQPSGGGVTEYRYDPLNRITRVQGPATSTGRVTNLHARDGRGNLTAVTLSSGGTTTWVYDPLSRRVRTINANGDTMRIRYDRMGNVRSIADFGTPAGESVEQRLYDERNRERNLRLRANRSWGDGPVDWHRITTDYDLAGNVTSQSHNLLTTPTTYSRDARGNVVSISHPEEVEERFTWDAVGNLVTERRFLKNVFGGGRTAVYDERNRVVGLQSDDTPAGSPEFRTTYYYDREDRLVRKVDPLGNVISAIWDERGNRTGLLDPLGPPLERRTYNDRDLPVEIERPDPQGVLRPFLDYSYDAAGRLVEQIDAVNYRRTYRYDSAGNLAGVTEPNGLRRSYRYDPVGNWISETSHAGSGDVTWAYEHDANGNVVKVTDPRGEEWRQEFDPLGRQVGLYYPRDSVNRYAWEYDVTSGRLRSRTDRNGNVSEYRYDDLGRLVRAEHSPDSLQQRVVTYGAYDLFGNPGQIDDEISSISRTYDLIGRLTAQTLSIDDGFVAGVSWTYDNGSNLTAVIDPEGSRHAYTYDRLNRLTEVSFEGRKILSHEYDAAGNLSSREHLTSGTEVAWEYSPRGEVVGVDVLQQGDVLVGSVDYDYDGMGNPVSTRWNLLGIRQSRWYDDLSRLTDEMWEGTGMLDTLVSWTYDPNGNRLSQTLGDSRVAYRYDHMNRLIGISLGEGQVSRLIPAERATASSTAPGFDPEILIDGVTTGDPTPKSAWRSGDEAAGTSATIGFHAPEQVAVVKLYFPDRNADVQAFRLQWYDGASYHDLEPLHSDGAEPSNRGDGWWSATDREVLLLVSPQLTAGIRFVQDSAGGTVGEPGRAMLNEIQAFTGTGADFDVEYRYDRNGNVVQRRSLRSDGEFVEDFSYDYADRNIDYVKRRNDDPMIVTRETFLPTGERFRVDEQRDGETVSTRFVGSGDNPLVDYTQVDGNELWTSAIHIQGEPEGVLFDPTTGGETLLIRDPIGSVIGSVDETGETGAWSIRTAFGSLLEGPAGAGRFGYAGGELEGSGLIDFRTRTYDPEIGRFLQVDPIDSNRIVNHYLRTAGSPPASPLPVIDTVRFEPPMPIEPMEGTFGPLWGLRADQRFADLP